MNKKVLFFTSSDNDFAPGAALLVYSLRKHVPNFESYDMKVFYTNLSDENKKMIGSVSSNVVFEKPRDMSYCSQALTIHGDDNKDTYLCFEAFRQQEYDQVVCLDSDMLCINDLSEILHEDYEKYPIMGCNKANEYRKRGEDKDSQKTNVLRSSGAKFNAGFISIGPKHLKDNLNTYVDLCKLVEKRTGRQWDTSRVTRGNRPYNDQDAIVEYWHDKNVFILPDYYNWKHWGAIGGSKEIENWGIKQNNMFINNEQNVKLIHYSGKRKPWGNKTNRDDGHGGKYDVCSVGDAHLMRETRANLLWHEYWEECFGEKFKTDWCN
tara:strand:+ start:1094 stop:2059 length:966 start_codon:yes stop_codon:yes gene_type:complete